MEHLKKIISDTPKRDNYFVADFNTFRERIVNYLQDLHEQVHECMNVINSINLEQVSGKDGKDGKDGLGVLNVLLNSDNSFTFFMTDGTVIITNPVHIEGGGGGDGEDGVGILNIEIIESSTESSGLNTIRVNLTNNTYYDFNIYNGAKGADGHDGINGKDGQDGKDGINGKDGKDGIDGVNGQDGQDGNDGKSAYQLAVEQGYSGTLQEWLLSLKGEPGADGADGVNGKDGIDGSDGKDGFSPYIDSTTGNWVDSTGDTGVHAQGPQGIQGIQGIQGQQGPAGTTVYMDLTGKPTLQDYDTQIETTFNIVLIDESDYNNLSVKNPTTIYLIKDTTT